MPFFANRFRSDPRIFARVARKNTLSPREEGSQETIGFLRIFGDFLCEQKVTRRMQDQPIHPPTPR